MKVPARLPLPCFGIAWHRQLESVILSLYSEVSNFEKGEVPWTIRQQSSLDWPSWWY